MKHLISVLGAGIASLCAASPALASDQPHSEEHTSATVTVGVREAQPRDLRPNAATSRAGGFVDLWPSRDNFATIFGGELQLGVTDRLFVDLSYAAAFARIGDAADAGDNLGYGNPTLGMHVVATPRPGFHAVIGASLTAPLLQDPSREVSNAAFYGQRIRGYYEADRFVRGHMAARLSVGMEWRATNALHIRGELRPVVFIPTNDEHPVLAKDRLDAPMAGGGRAEVNIEHALEIEGRTDMGVGFGARLQGVGMPMQDDVIQLTAEPFINLTPRREGVYARIGVPLAIDEGLGFGLQTNRLAGIRLQIGGQW